MRAHDTTIQEFETDECAGIRKLLDGIAAGCVFPGFQRVAAICSKPYDDLTITEAMARLLASDDPKARSF